MSIFSRLPLLASGLILTSPSWASDPIPVTVTFSLLGDLVKLVGGDKSNPVVVYCAPGHRATTAKAQLEAAGYSNVVNGAGYDDLR